MGHSKTTQQKMHWTTDSASAAPTAPGLIPDRSRLNPTVLFPTLLCAGVAEWQTRSTQNALLERACGFESHHRHNAREFDPFGGFQCGASNQPVHNTMDGADGFSAASNEPAMAINGETRAPTRKAPALTQ